MSRTLRLAADLTLPPEAVTETFGILAARGAGKSNLAAVMAEQMFAAGLPFVVVDPVGSWFGLRAGADGQKNGGLSLPIFGGKHGDVPLERHGGELLADLVVSKRLSCVLDLSGFESEAAKKAFLLDFARRLYAKNEDPLHLFLEEADDYIPQRPMRDEAQLLRAWENIVRRGRARGLGLTLITQRSASLNKSVLTQVQTLFVLRTTGPQDRAAIEAWVKYHDTDAQVLASLSGLDHGEGWVWSPQFLARMSRHQFHRRQTFDSGATPKNLRGKDARPAATLADVDLSALQVQMAATIERAKADDPKELRRQLADVRKQLAEAQWVGPSNQQASAPSVQVSVLTDADRERVEKMRTELTAAVLTIRERVAQAQQVMEASFRAAMEQAAERVALQATRVTEAIAARLEAAGFQKTIDALQRVSIASNKITAPDTRRPLAHRPAQVNPKITAVRQPLNGAGESLPPGERAVLTAAAMYAEGVTRDQLGVLTGYKRSSRDAYIARLAQKGLVEVAGGQVLATEGGVHALGPDFEPLPTGAALLDWWRARLPKGERDVLEVLVSAAGRPVPREDIDQATGFKRSSRDAYLARLSSRRLVESVGRGEVRASQELF